MRVAWNRTWRSVLGTMLHAPTYQVLAGFYSVHDPSKSEADCQAILDKRRGDDAAMSQSAYSKLCATLGKKYDQNPIDLARQQPQAVEPAPAPEPAAAAEPPSAAPLKGAVPDSFEGQLAVLQGFYATHEASKSADEVRGILDKRRGDAPALGQVGPAPAAAPRAPRLEQVSATRLTRPSIALSFSQRDTRATADGLRQAVQEARQEVRRAPARLIVESLRSSVGESVNCNIYKSCPRC